MMRLDSIDEAIREVHHGGMDTEELLRHGIAIGQAVDFSSNILNAGPSPRVRAAVHAVVFDQYPDRNCQLLRRAIADRYAVDIERLLVGNGCSELIHSVAASLIEPKDDVLIIGPTFSEYERAARIAGGNIRRCDANAVNEFAVPLSHIEAMLAQYSLRVVWICNPNNPTGQSISKLDLKRWIQQHPQTVFVVDESYIEFAEHTESLLGSDFENLVVLRSMTKAYSMAGLRLGFAWLPSSLYQTICDRRIPWSVNGIAQAAGIAALQDKAYFAIAMSRLRAAKHAFFGELMSRGLEPIPSDTGFFLLRVEHATQVREKLIDDGLIVRDCHSFGLDGFLRIAVLDPPNNQRLANSLVRLTGGDESPIDCVCDAVPAEPTPVADEAAIWDEVFRNQLDQLFRLRRDVRRFRGDAVAAGSLRRWIAAACLAPSVGLSQPWRFVSVNSSPARAAVIAEFETQNAIAATKYDDATATHYRELKLAGLREAPEHLAVFVDDAATEGRGLGRSTMPETLEYSVVAAIQNLWLAARAEGVGVGWVSILRPEIIRKLLNVPNSWRLIAYLCLGYPQINHDDVPELQREHWEQRNHWNETWHQR